MAEHDLTDAIADSAAGPKDVSIVGQGSSSEHSLSEQIKADVHLANRRAIGPTRGFGLRFARINPPGTQ